LNIFSSFEYYLKNISYKKVSYFMDPKEKIKTLRNKIDDLDNQILNFLVQRFSISREIGDIKAYSEIEICGSI